MQIWIPVFVASYTLYRSREVGGAFMFVNLWFLCSHLISILFSDQLVELSVFAFVYFAYVCLIHSMSGDPTHTNQLFNNQSIYLRSQFAQERIVSRAQGFIQF